VAKRTRLRGLANVGERRPIKSNDGVGICKGLKRSENAGECVRKTKSREEKPAEMNCLERLGGTSPTH